MKHEQAHRPVDNRFAHPGRWCSLPRTAVSGTGTRCQETEQTQLTNTWEKGVRMRRLMLGMSQAKLGDALVITFQQVQKYEKGTNRISASRLQHISETFQVPVEFFFEGVPHMRGQHSAQTDAPSPQFVSDYLATSDGLKLTKAFMQIPNARLRRSIANLVEQIAAGSN
jgi:transcriptional regulator with XRE-family HTH domain